MAYWARRAAFLCFSSWETSFGFTTILACFSIMLAMAWTSSGKERSQSVSWSLRRRPGSPSCHAPLPSPEGTTPRPRPRPLCREAAVAGDKGPKLTGEVSPQNIPHPPPTSLPTRPPVGPPPRRAQRAGHFGEPHLGAERAGAAEEPPRRWFSRRGGRGGDVTPASPREEELPRAARGPDRTLFFLERGNSHDKTWKSGRL